VPAIHRIDPDRPERSTRTQVENGLYEIFFHTVHGTGSGVIYAIDGKLRGGNSAFTFTGNYHNKPDMISVKVSTRRFNPDPDIKSLFGFEGVTLSLTGQRNGDTLAFEGNALQKPGLLFKAQLTRVSD
jgi:hypothetical protein